MNKRTQQKREGILEEMRKIERLRQGSISEQFYGAGENKQGPYYILQGYEEGKHWSKRISRDQIAQVRQDLGAGARFKDLCQDFAEVTEQATVAQDHAESKKNARKRTGSVTRKPKRS